MPKKPKLTQADIDVFKNAVSGTQILINKKIRLSPKTPKRIIHSENKSKDNFNFDETISPDHVSSDDFIAYKHPSVSNKILRKLRKGQYNVEAVLDLHGMTVEEAKIVVEDFLCDALQTGKRVVLIIHGKGRHSHMPVLKNKINNWLRQLPIVLAFCSAVASHGNRGAIYALLKRSIQEETGFE